MELAAGFLRFASGIAPPRASFDPEAAVPWKRLSRPTRVRAIQDRSAAKHPDAGPWQIFANQEASLVRTPRIRLRPGKMQCVSAGLALLALLVAASNSFANATSYRCTDRNGKSLAGDGPPSNDCWNNICTFTNGIKKCEGETASEPDERARSPRVQSDHQQWLSDIALIDRYPTEARIEADREAELQLVRRRIADAERDLKLAQDQRHDERPGGLQSELDFHARGPMPPELADRMKTNDVAQREAQRAIRDAKADERQIDAKYDEYVRRFRALRNKMKNP